MICISYLWCKNVRTWNTEILENPVIFRTIGKVTIIETIRQNSAARAGGGRRKKYGCFLLLFSSSDHYLRVLFVCSDGSPITQPQQIEMLQDTSQSSLEQYIRAQYSNQPTRFGKLLLMLSSLRKIEPAVIEQLFFAEVLRGASMGDVLKKMLTSKSSAPVVHGSLMAWTNTNIKVTLLNALVVKFR